MLAFSNDYYGMIFRATQSVELFCAYFHGTNPTLSTISKICSGFGITVSEFFQADYFLICEDD